MTDPFKHIPPFSSAPCWMYEQGQWQSALWLRPDLSPRGRQTAMMYALTVDGYTMARQLRQADVQADRIARRIEAAKAGRIDRDMDFAQLRMLLFFVQRAYKWAGPSQKEHRELERALQRVYERVCRVWQAQAGDHLHEVFQAYEEHQRYLRLERRYSDCPQRAVLWQGPIAGVRYHEGLTMIRTLLKPGYAVHLHREPDNPHDPHAIRVTWYRHMLGYIPRRENAVLARLLDQKVHLKAHLVDVRPDAEPWQALEVLVRLTEPTEPPDPIIPVYWLHKPLRSDSTLYRQVIGQCRHDWRKGDRLYRYVEPALPGTDLGESGIVQVRRSMPIRLLQVPQPPRRRRRRRYE